VSGKCGYEDLKQGVGGERVQRANGNDRGSNPPQPTDFAPNNTVRRKSVFGADLNPEDERSEVLAVQIRRESEALSSLRSLRSRGRPNPLLTEDCRPDSTVKNWEKLLW